MTSRVTLRKYQEELAEPGLRGENSIIYAPPGSGKTLVVGHIANEVLKRKGKIFFIISVQRVGQQHVDELKKIITKGDVQLVTNTEDLKHKYKAANSVFILTPKILMNGIDYKMVKFKDIKLLIVDECQHALTQHNHRKLMEYYWEQKQELQPGEFPQVIGLTSSLGLASSKNPWDKLAKLCAILDGDVTIVKDNIEELKQFSPDAQDEEVKKVYPRDKDSPFGKELKEFMEFIQSFIQSHPEFQKMPSVYVCGTKQYESWIRTYKTKQSALDTEAAQDAVAVCKALEICCKALHIYHQVQAKFALNVLDQYFKEKRNSAFLEVERNIIEKYFEKQEQFQTLAAEETIEDNEKLVWLRKILNETFAEDESSKVLVLAKTMEESKALCDFIKSQELKNVVADRFVGQRKKKELAISCENQIRIVDRFKKGGINVLIATDGAKEGIDMPRCNLVIRYNFWNDGSLQSISRLRTHDCKAFLITDTDTMKRHLVTEDAKLAKERIEQWKASGQMEKDITEKRQKILNERKDDENVEKKTETGNTYRIVCKACKTELCDGTEIFRKGRHFICTKDSFDQMVEFQPREEKKFQHNKIIGVIFCKKCKSQLGPKSEYSPPRPRSEGFCLNIKAVQFKIDTEENCLFYSQWKKVPFHIKQEPVYEAVKISSSKFLDELSEEIGKDWRRIGIRLGIRDEQLDQLEYKNPHNVQNAIYQMLRLWWEERQEKNKSVDQRCKELKHAFREVQHQELVEWVETKQAEYKIDDEQRGPGEEWANHEKYVKLKEIKNIFATLQLKDENFSNTKEEQRTFLLKYGHIAWFSICNPDEQLDTPEDPTFQEILVDNPLFQQAAMAYYVFYCMEQDDNKPWEDMEKAFLTMEKKAERNGMLKFCAKYSTEAEGKTREFYKKAFEEHPDNERLLSILPAIKTTSLEWDNIKYLCQWKADDQILNDFEGQAELLDVQVSIGLEEKDTILSSVCIIDNKESKVKKALEENKFSLKEAFVVIRNDIYPSIEPGGHSIAWLVLDKPKTQDATKFLQSICEESKRPFGVCVLEPGIKGKELQKLLELLAECSKVKHACIGIEKQKWKHIKEALETISSPKRKALNKLVLKEECLDSSDIPALVKLIYRSDGLYALDLTMSPNTMKTCKENLCEALEGKGECSLLELGLNLTGSGTSVNAETAVSKLIKCSPNLEVLSVIYCMFDISETILGLSKLTSLDISKTCVTLEEKTKGMGIINLFEKFNLLANLKTFNANWCRIDKVTISKLNLDQGSELETLYLRYNQLGDKGFEKLIEKLKAAKNLKKLDVGENRISLHDVQYKGTMGNLEELDLSHNEIKLDDARQFCQSLASCDKFKTLSLQQMKIPLDRALADEITSYQVVIDNIPSHQA